MSVSDRDSDRRSMARKSAPGKMCKAPRGARTQTSVGSCVSGKGAQERATRAIYSEADLLHSNYGGYAGLHT
jgi:hypothetical protein